MKNVIRILFLICFIGIQTITYAKLNTKRIETKQFHKKTDPVHYKYVDMDFNSSAIQNKLSRINAEEVQSITLVYTQFKLVERFDQLALNTKRIDLLLKKFPKFKHPNIKWYWVAQTGCSDPEACGEYFHGFEIRTKTKAEVMAATAATNLLDYYMDLYSGKETGSSVDSLIDIGESSLIKVCDTTSKSRIYHSRLGALQGVRQTSKKLFFERLKIYKVKPEPVVVIQTDERNRVTSVTGVDHGQERIFLASLKRYYRFRTSRFEGKRVLTEYTLHFKEPKGAYYRDFDIMVTPLNMEGVAYTSFEDKKVVTTTESCYYTDTSMSAVYGTAPDNVVTEVFERNPQWQNCIIATDVTGSMYPYMGQFLVWHEKNLDKRKGNHDFVFFNDGDMLPNELKKTGETGGTYYVQTANYHSLKEKMTVAMTKGGGGDQPENNLEAILFGLQKNPDCKEVILIADNWATPRDMALLNKIKVPVHVILCGSTSLNLEYVKVARKTKGSIHTIEHDLYNLDKIEFSKNGKWVDVKN